jgi:hypothetical protein
VDDVTKQSIGEVLEQTVEAAEETVRRPGVKSFARFGFFAKGFLFIFMGALAILLVIGERRDPVGDAAGALADMAVRPYGKVLLGIFIFGALGHGFWNILRGTADVDDAGRGWQGILKRSISIGIGVFYLGLAASAFEIILAARRVDTVSQPSASFVGILLAIPIFGAMMSIIIGLGAIGAGLHECYSGLTGKYRENYRLWEISGPHHILIYVLGVLSFTARALLLVIMGYLFIEAAFGTSAGSIGMDAALMALLSTSYGRFLVMFTAIGLISHGVLALFEAKYRRIC